MGKLADVKTVNELEQLINENPLSSPERSNHSPGMKDVNVYINSNRNLVSRLIKRKSEARNSYGELPSETILE